MHMSQSESPPEGTFPCVYSFSRVTFLMKYGASQGQEEIWTVL